MSTEIAVQEAPFDPKALAIQIKDMPQVYIDLSERASKAIAAGNKLIEKIKTNGMDEETATEITTHIKKVKNTLVIIKEQRTPYTQLLDIVKKAFTGIEAGIKTSNDTLKVYLDTYATEQAELQRKREEEARVQAAKEKELGDIEAELERGLKTSFINLLALKKTYLNSILEDMTLEIHDSVRTVMTGFSEDIPVAELKWPAIDPAYTTPEQVKEIKVRVGKSLAAEMKAQYAQEIADTKKELLDKIPSKVAELQEAKRIADEQAEQARLARIAEEKRREAIKKANAAEKTKLEAEAAKAREQEEARQEALRKQQEALEAEKKKRQEEEQQRLAEEAAKAKAEAESEAKAKAESASMNAMFNLEVAKSESAVPKGKAIFTITVTHQQGYADMFALWFAKEGGKMDLEALEKISLGRIKTYFEKLAADGEKMDSRYIKYKESFQTSVRR